MTRYVIELAHYYWRITAPNGEVLSHSQQYATKWNAKRAAKRLSALTGWDVIQVGMWDSGVK